jgi:hypothetical protein
MSFLRLFGGALDCIHRGIFSANNPGVLLMVTKKALCTTSGEKVGACYHTQEDCFYVSELHMEEILSVVNSPFLRSALVISIALHESRHRAQIHGLVPTPLHPNYFLPKPLAKEVWQRARSGHPSSVKYELDAYTLQYIFHQVTLRGRTRSISELVRLAAYMASLDAKTLTQKFAPFKPAQ